MCNSYVELNYRWPVEVPKIKTKTRVRCKPRTNTQNEIAIATPVRRFYLGKPKFPVYLYSHEAQRRQMVMNELNTSFIYTDAISRLSIVGVNSDSKLRTIFLHHLRHCTQCLGIVWNIHRFHTLPKTASHCIQSLGIVHKDWIIHIACNIYIRTCPNDIYILLPRPSYCLETPLLQYSDLWN